MSIYQNEGRTSYNKDMEEMLHNYHHPEPDTHRIEQNLSADAQQISEHIGEQFGEHIGIYTSEH